MGDRLLQAALRASRDRAEDPHRLLAGSWWRHPGHAAGKVVAPRRQPTAIVDGDVPDAIGAESIDEISHQPAQYHLLPVVGRKGILRADDHDLAGLHDSLRMTYEFPVSAQRAQQTFFEPDLALKPEARPGATQ